jgi:hypothetical protein
MSRCVTGFYRLAAISHQPPNILNLTISKHFLEPNQSRSYIAVSRPVHLGVRHPSGTSDQIFFLFEIFFRELQVCHFVAPSLTRGRLCNLLLLLVLASAMPVGSDSRGTEYHWGSLNLEVQVSVFITPRNRVAQIYPRELGSLSIASYDSQGYGTGILSRLYAGTLSNSKSKSRYDWQSVGQSVLVSGTHPWHATTFTLDSCGFVIL